jgi:hypothetical protein
MNFPQELTMAMGVSALIMLAYALILAVIDQRPKKDPHKR